MRTTSNLLKTLAVVSALLPFCSSGLAQSTIVYDNSLTDLNRIVTATNGVEYGDQITLDPATTARTINDVKFEYYLSQNANGNETLQLTLHANDGPITTHVVNGQTVSVSAPGTVLYTSPILNLQTGFQVAEASQFQVQVANTFTWTVTFGGIDPGEVAGLRLYDPPTVGSSFSDFWQKNNGTWNTYVLDVPANFAARVTAVPEPTTLAYVLLAGLSGLGYLGFKLRS